MTQTITENIYASVTHNISQKSTAKNAKTKAVLNQAVADLSKAVSIVHQVHWYMRNASLDEMSERLITIGGAPYSTLKEFDDHSKLEEVPGSFEKTMDEHLARLVDVYTYLSALYQVGLDVTDEEGDAPSNDLFTAAQAEAEKTIWMLQAERGQASGIK